MKPMLVTVKARSSDSADGKPASRRTKNRTGEAMWLLDISHPDCMGGKKCGRFESKKSSSQMVMNGRSMSSEVWHGWLPLDELIIKKDGKFLDLA